jgi:hypothetical protein
MEFKIDEKKVYEMIRWMPGGARFPYPIPLMYAGRPTPEASDLGWGDENEELGGWGEFEQAVFTCVKRLHEAGRVIFISRHGYTWVVPPYVDHEPEELVDEPDMVNRPYNWDRL